jgi:VWFA-related protein
MPQVIEAGKALTDIWPDDRVFVVRFVNSEKTKAVQDLTSDKAALVDALDRMYTEEGLTAILDAVYKSAQYLTEKNANDPAENRRALILITDGLDERSDYKLETVISRLRASGVKVFAIGFPQAARQQGANMERMATDFLTRLAEGTGGRAYFPRSTAQITTTAQGILYDLRNH